MPLISLLRERSETWFLSRSVSLARSLTLLLLFPASTQNLTHTHSARVRVFLRGSCICMQPLAQLKRHEPSIRNRGRTETRKLHPRTARPRSCGLDPTPDLKTETTMMGMMAAIVGASDASALPKRPGTCFPRQMDIQQRTLLGTLTKVSEKRNQPAWPSLQPCFDCSVHVCASFLRLSPPQSLSLSPFPLFFVLLFPSRLSSLASTANFLLSECNSEGIPETRAHYLRNALYSRRIVLVEPVTKCLHSEYFSRAWTLHSESHDRMQLACFAYTQWRHNHMQLARCGQTDGCARGDSASLQESRFEDVHARGESSLGASRHSRRLTERGYTSSPLSFA